MKKILLTLCLGASAIGLTQETETTDNLPPSQKHEIRIDAFEVLAINTIEFNYEYILSKYTGIGAAISFGWDEGSDFENYQNFAFTPYFRQYFFNKKDYGARGLFAEGMLQVASGERWYEDFFEDGNSNTTSNNWTNFGIGFALGQKWVSRNGFVLEISIGGGRYIGNADASPEGFIRGGILVGYRF
jgi:hypothetical protein